MVGEGEGERVTRGGVHVRCCAACFTAGLDCRRDASEADLAALDEVMREAEAEEARSEDEMLLRPKGVLTALDGKRYAGRWSSRSPLVAGPHMLTVDDGTCIQGSWVNRRHPAGAVFEGYILSSAASSLMSSSSSPKLVFLGQPHRSRWERLFGAATPHAMLHDRLASFRRHCVARRLSFSASDDEDGDVLGEMLPSAPSSRRIVREAVRGDAGDAPGGDDGVEDAQVLFQHLYDEFNREDGFWFDRLDVFQSAFLAAHASPLGDEEEAFLSDGGQTGSGGGGVIGTMQLQRGVADVLSFVAAFEHAASTTYKAHLTRSSHRRALHRLVHECVFPLVHSTLAALYQRVYRARDRDLAAVLHPLRRAQPCDCLHDRDGVLTQHADRFDDAARLLARFPSQATATRKLHVLVDVARAVDAVLGDLLAPSSSSPGADILWPVFQYILLRAQTHSRLAHHLLADVAMLKDAFSDELEAGDAYAYRIMVLETTLDMVRRLQWDCRDENGVMVPSQA